MFLRQRELEVDGGQKSKDISLQGRDQKLKERERDAKGDGSNSEESHPGIGIQDEEVGGGEEQDKQEVTHDHVHQQTESQRDRAKNERRDKLDRRHDDVERPRHTRGQQSVLQESAGVLAQTRIHKGQVSGNGEDQGHSDHTGARNVQTGNNSRHIHEPDEKENGGQQRKEALAILLAQQVLGDVHPNQIQRHLNGSLEPARNHSHLPSAQPEDQDEGDDREKPDQNDSVDLKNGALEEHRWRKEFLNRRGTESFTGC